MHLKNQIGKYFYLVAGLVLFLTAVLVDSLYNEDKPDYVNQVTRKLNHELIEIEEDFENVLENLADVPSFNFTNLEVETHYPYYIFRNERLLYWSDNRFVPEYQEIAGDYTYKLVDLPEGQFIMRKFSINHSDTDLEIYSALPIFIYQKIDNKYLQSGFNSDIFSSSEVTISGEKEAEGYQIFTEDGNYLISIKFEDSYKANTGFYPVLILILITCALVFIVAFILKLYQQLIRNRKIEMGLIFLVTTLVVIRALMLIYKFPFQLVELKLFNSLYYASSVINPSLGDLLLNLLVFLVIAWQVFLHFYRTSFYRMLIRLSEQKQAIFSILIIAYSYFQLYFNFLIFRAINFHSQWSLDINFSLSFGYLKLISLLIIFINACIYFLLAHIIFKVYLRINRRSQFLLVFDFIIGTLLFVAISLIFDFNFWTVTIVNFVYFLVLYTFELPKFLASIRYHTFIYFFLSAMVTAIIGAYSVYLFEQVKDANYKQRLMDQLLIENDYYGEFQLSEVSKRIQDDVFIKNRLINPFFSKDIIEQKIKRVYLSSYFDKYDIQVWLFNGSGDPIKPVSLPNYDEIRSRLGRASFATDYEDIFFINQIGSGRNNNYVEFIEIKRADLTIGYIIIRLTLKRIIPTDVYPTLLVDQRFIQSQMVDENYRDYSYGIFSDGSLSYSAGVFNYYRNFPRQLLDNPELFEEDGITQERFRHLGAQSSDGRVVIVSSPVYPFIYLVSNFSFLFLFLIFLVLTLVIVNAVAQNVKRVQMNYATKIQLYSNFSFFLPLLVISITTLSVIISSYKRDVEVEYVQRAESLSTNDNLFEALQNYNDGNSSPEELTSQLILMSRYADMDINLFNINGQLLATSQPAIYENNFLSEHINPGAIAAIKEQKVNSLILDEDIGDLNYKTSYSSLRSLINGDLIGIIGIPFFESRNDLNMRIIQVFTSIINIFTFILLVFLAISYFASKWVTFPLELITQKIRKTSLSEYNEPLSWNSDDEIGLLVGEYNRMLIKLEESKIALARSEKETAWREIAKQVAHEIKNPLTPMKLTLQHLRRLIHEKDPELTLTVDKRVNSLLHQIDTLSDIATSFSAFAQMPVPETERFEITSTLRKTVSLYNNQENGTVDADLEDGTYYVLGDEQWLGRTFSNLIINGFQAVPGDRDPKVELALRKTGPQKICIEVKDNGEGIPEEIREKIFIPNFSTKYAGSGIGLAVAKRGIEHAGGKIWFETEVGKGTSFFVELPLLDSDAALS